MRLRWADLTWRCRSGQPKPAKSQDGSGQLYRRRRTVSPTISSLVYLIPMLLSVVVMSFSE